MSKKEENSVPEEEFKKDSNLTQDESNEKKVEDEITEGVTCEQEKVVAENLESLKSQIEDLKDKWLRTAAELENSKKRWLREREDIVEYTLADVMKNILPLLDHFDKAMENLPQEKTDFETGVEIIFKELHDIFSKYGLIKIDNLVAIDFDPFEHEAISYEESEEIPEGKIIEVLRPGYKLRNRLLRAATVKVSKGKKKSEQ